VESFVTEKALAVCSLCETEFKTRGNPPRHKCEDGRTGTGLYIEEIPTEEVPIIAGDVEIEVPDEEGMHFEPDALVMDVPPEPESGPERGPQAPKSTKKDVNKIDHLLMTFAAAFDNAKYTPEEKAQIIAQLFADSLDVRVETSQVIIGQRQFAMLSAVAVLLLLGKERLQPALAFYRKSLHGKPDIADPFGES
tara:strand:- start:123 stop:704 length:582 start_codon:yes stop_codon:yes gene_type:complete